MTGLKADRSKAMQLLLHEHVDQRLKRALGKWEGRNDSLAKQEIKKANEKYELSRILEKGAACSTNISVATHIAKATHPDLKVRHVTNLNVRFSELYGSADIGSHLLNDEESLADTTGDGAYNSAAYELYLLLDLRFEGKSLGGWIQQKDRDAIAAFSENIANEKEAENLVNRYIALLDDKAPRYSTDTRAKQIYWCVGSNSERDADYHLLQPLFSSSLTQAVHQELNDARFGERNKLARQAYRDRKPHDAIYRDYRGLVMRKLGGTKPQNISQLNSERGGVNYLFSSLPPHWDKKYQRRLFFVETSLEHFRRYEGVSGLIKSLVNFLKSSGGRTMETETIRENIERKLGESLAAFGWSIRQLYEPGWTRNPDCKLAECEQLWLDPGRAELSSSPEGEDEDRTFQQALEWKDWPDEVAHRFGNWLNAILLKEGLPVGDVEHAHWAKQSLIDAEWPAPRQRRALKKEALHDSMSRV